MYEELLARVPLFQDLSRRELTWLADACRERAYAVDDVLVRQGGSGVGLLIVLEGSARVTRQAVRAADTEREIDMLGPGAVWGESALLEDAPSPATITALEPTRAVMLPIWDFHMTLRELPDLAIHLLVTLSRRAQGAGPNGRADASNH